MRTAVLRVIGCTGIMFLTVVACHAGSGPSASVDVGDGVPGVLEHPHAVSTAQQAPGFISTFQNMKKSIEETVKAKKRDIKGDRSR